MGLRPAKTCRTLDKPAWARFSQKKPRKSFVKSMPHNAVQIFDMGVANAQYEIEMRLVAKEDVQVRDNSLEAARQAANKYLEKVLPGAYYLKVNVFPHNVIRENKMIVGAGADRLQTGMQHPFGRPSDRAARIRRGQRVFTMKVNKSGLEKANEAMRRAKGKMSGKFEVLKCELA